MLQRRWLKEIGYTEDDDLDGLGREDNSYLFRFLFKECVTQASVVRLHCAFGLRLLGFIVLWLCVVLASCRYFQERWKRGLEQLQSGRYSHLSVWASGLHHVA